VPVTHAIVHDTTAAEPTALESTLEAAPSTARRHKEEKSTAHESTLEAAPSTATSKDKDNKLPGSQGYFDCSDDDSCGWEDCESSSSSSSESTEECEKSPSTESESSSSEECEESHSTESSSSSSHSTETECTPKEPCDEDNGGYYEGDGGDYYYAD
jgi:hypothetical protein